MKKKETSSSCVKWANEKTSKSQQKGSTNDSTNSARKMCGNAKAKWVTPWGNSDKAPPDKSPEWQVLEKLANPWAKFCARHDDGQFWTFPGTTHWCHCIGCAFLLRILPMISVLIQLHIKNEPLPVAILMLCMASRLLLCNCWAIGVLHWWGTALFDDVEEVLTDSAKEKWLNLASVVANVDCTPTHFDQEAVETICQSCKDPSACDAVIEHSATGTKKKPFSASDCSCIDCMEIFVTQMNHQALNWSWPNNSRKKVFWHTSPLWNSGEECKNWLMSLCVLCHLSCSTWEHT